MRVYIDRIPEEGLHVEGSIEPVEIGLDMPGYKLEEPLAFSGQATRSEDDIYVRGKVRGSANAQCGRCLENFLMPLDLEVAVAFVPRKEQSEQEEEIVEEDTNLSLYDGDSIDLLPEIRDLLFVSLPIRPVCRPDCRGLCSHCGADLNKSSCKCEERLSASPFEKLKELKSKLEGR